jgi:hypothetical protein
MTTENTKTNKKKQSNAGENKKVKKRTCCQG